MELSPDQLRITCDPACLEPGSTVTVSLDTEVRLPLTRTPSAANLRRSTQRLHTEPYGDYREAKGNR